jgi:hypothetical protein
MRRGLCLKVEELRFGVEGISSCIGRGEGTRDSPFRARQILLLSSPERICLEIAFFLVTVFVTHFICPSIQWPLPCPGLRHEAIDYTWLNIGGVGLLRWFSSELTTSMASLPPAAVRRLISSMITLRLG